MFKLNYCIHITHSILLISQQSKNHLWFLPFHHVNAWKAQKNKIHIKATMLLPLECALMGREGKVIYMCVQSVMTDSLWPHGLQHTRPPCPLPIPGVYLNSCPLSRWCHPTISSSVVPLSTCLQSFPASGFFHMSQFFESGCQSIGVSASTWVLPMNIQDWFPSG